MSATSSSSPSAAGHRLLHVTIDKIAVDSPGRIWAAIPRSTTLSDGYRDISFAALANAINRLSWFLESKIGRSESFKAVAYIGPPDMRYHVMSMSAAKTGYKALYSSHTNSLAGHLNLLEKCECNDFISAKGVDVEDILSSRQMRHFRMPELEDLLNEELVPQYPYEKSFEEAKLDVYLVLHTSGSTGLPKPIPINHAYSAALDAQCRVPEQSIGGRLWPLWRCTGALEPVRELVPFAPFHVISAAMILVHTVFGSTVYVFGPLDSLMNPQNALQIMDLTPVDRAFVYPAMLEDFATKPDALDKLAKLSEVIYGGGSLSLAAGTKISSMTRLANIWGSTETSTMILYRTDPEDWAYIGFEQHHSGIEWRDAGEDSAGKRFFELVFVRRPGLEQYQPVFAIYPDLDEWPTHDIWSKHPTKAHHWHYEGRLDDLICYTDGLKYHPTNEETNLCSNPLITSALMLGTQRKQTALLVELRNDTGRDEAELVEDIWPTVAEANAAAPSMAQVAKTHILLAKAGRPFVRAGKGTVQRPATFELYKREIDDLYARMGDKGAPAVTRVK